ncbi:hypothetical protein [Mangrovibacter yixingensis]|uniref:hypothetical protein n=1 Tax=Mangrovibacter yixingensis TaxID=1529639 RepID=UPI001CFA44A4|nr:hypothetical protein [Mangrovibacter yixingensis]
MNIARHSPSFVPAKGIGGFHFEREVADPEHQSARLFFTLSRGRWRASQEADAK